MAGAARATRARSLTPRTLAELEQGQTQADIVICFATATVPIVRGAAAAGARFGAAAIGAGHTRAWIPWCRNKHLSADRVHLLHIGFTAQHLFDAVLFQGEHTRCRGSVENVAGKRLGLNHALDCGMCHEQFV